MPINTYYKTGKKTCVVPHTLNQKLLNFTNYTDRYLK